MTQIRRSSERGHLNHGWLDTYHSFSFADYYDPNFMGYRSLRVINQDVIAPGGGFGTHPHRDMEILTYVLEGSLEHRDSLGNGAVIRPGVVQYMSAGSGIRHSEFNPSATEPTHLYQIWLLPRAKGLEPRYHQHKFDPADRAGKWQLVAAPGGLEGSLPIEQDAQIYLADLPSGGKIDFELAENRHASLQVLRGSVNLNGHTLSTSDAAAMSNEAQLLLHAPTPCELMLFDLS